MCTRAMSYCVGWIIIILVVHTSSYGTCDDVFHIEKYTVASSNSYRDTFYAYNIFPYLDEQETEHFIAGMCANGMKVQLPDTCFKLHAPQTWQHDEGLLKVETLEKKFTKKWNYVMSTAHNTYNYDIFLDFNIAFWVQSLDPYLEKWQQFVHENTDDTFNDKLQYFGIEWHYNLEDIDLEIHSTDYENNKFYSILLHSPESGINYEFISYTKPSSVYYKSMKWIYSNIQRATFKAHNDPYPWNRADQTPIVPVRISRACTDIDAMIDFYSDVMQAQILYNSDGVIVDNLGGDYVDTKTVVLIAGDTQIELQFYQRSEYYTAGDFTLQEYEELLMETHNEVITTPYCGIDRWFDNHYGFSTWSMDGYLDRIMQKLNERNEQKYRIYQTPYEHSSVSGKMNLDKYGASTTYIFFVFEPGGQSIQMMGDFKYTNFGLTVPNWNAQWCYTRCPYNMHEGKVNAEHIYRDIEDYNDLLIEEDYNAAESHLLLSLLRNQTVSSQYDDGRYVLHAVMMVIICGCIIIMCVKQREKHSYELNEQMPLIANIEI